VSIRDYVYHRLGKANEFGEWTRLISTGTQSNLNADKVKNFKIQIPQIIDEIKNISTFFNQLDSLIALHQRKPFIENEGIKMITSNFTCDSLFKDYFEFCIKLYKEDADRSYNVEKYRIHHKYINMINNKLKMKDNDRNA